MNNEQVEMLEKLTYDDVVDSEIYHAVKACLAERNALKEERGDLAPMPHFEIRSLHPARLPHGPYERALFDEWVKENKREQGTNYGMRTLEGILHVGGWGRGLCDGPQNFKFITQRDADVATATLQWLGTNCGRCFLDMALKRGQEYRKEYDAQKKSEWDATIASMRRQ